MRPRCEPFRAFASRFLGSGHGQQPENRGLLSLTLARPLVFTLAVGSGIALDQGAFVYGTQVGFLILVACYLMTGLYLFLSALRLRISIQLALQIVMDALLVTGLVSATGVSNSQYVLLYFVLILYASMYSSFRGAITAAGLCAGGYALTWWSRLLPWQANQPSYSFTEASLRVLFHGILFMTVGVLGGFLARRVEQQDKRLMDAKDELQRIKLGTDVILHSIGSGIMSIDSEGRVIHFNRTASNIFGLDPAIVQHRHFEEVLGLGLSPVAELLRRGLSQGFTVWRGEVEITSADNRQIPLGINTSLVVTESGKRAGVIALCQDLTEVKRTEERVKRQETLAALGQFSAGIAHEIRNCLSPIIGSVELLNKELSLDGDSRQLMNLISTETERLEVFLKELLFYARAKALDEEVVNLRQLIDETIEIVRRHPAHSIGKTLTCRFHVQEIRAKLDAEQMKRVFVNLAVNALEAIEDQGEVLIRTYVEEVAANTCDQSCAAVVVEFEDNGIGIPADELKRVLEPFYSTKGSGTGLGLSIAQRVVEKHNGRLSIESQSGRGTKVRVHLPLYVADRIDTTCLTQKAA